MKPILKWPGGKEKELPEIKENIPNYKGRYIEPFVGGGAVFFDIENSNSCINDKSEELMNFYERIKNDDKEFRYDLQKKYDNFRKIDDIISKNKKQILNLYNGKISVDSFVSEYRELFIQLVLAKYKEVFIKELTKNLRSKINRSNHLEAEVGQIGDEDRLNNMEAAIKSAYYMYIRYLYNHKNEQTEAQQAANFFIIREYCYSSMFRYNKDGDFNVPYGGISYNNKDFQKKIDYLFSKQMNEKLKNTKMSCDDFEVFMNKIKPTKDDFIFLDPPYDTDFSTYSQNEFGKNEQKRLCEYLKKTPAKIMLIIKNTDYIFDLYKDDFNIRSFDKKYLVSFMNRNSKEVKHLIITNY